MKKLLSNKSYKEVNEILTELTDYYQFIPIEENIKIETDEKNKFIKFKSINERNVYIAFSKLMN